MTLLTQTEIEDQMYGDGIDRTRARIAGAEARGEAQRNPYAATVYRDYVLPLAAVLHEDIMKPQKAGVRAAHRGLLATLALDTVALLAVRTVLTSLLSPQSWNQRTLGYAIGKAVHCELVLAQIEHLSPDLYHTLAADFNRRRSKDVRHRMTVFKMQAAKNGILYEEWSVGARDQVGLFLLDLLCGMGLVCIDPPPKFTGKGGQRYADVRLSPEVLEQIDQIKGLVEVTSPKYGPCVEPPRDWTAFNDGGFHTYAMRRVHPYLVKAPSAARRLVADAAMPTVLCAVNALQRTAWRVNERILDSVMELSKTVNIGEVVTVQDTSKPAPPAWLKDTDKAATMNEAQTAEFVAWKRSVAEWFTQRKLMGVQYGRFHSATRAAQTFREYPALYFVYFADSRGRLYPLTYGMNPQGSDLQKALLQFADGMTLDTPDARRWFCIHGANKWGFDKATLQARADWHIQHHDQIMAIASDPVGNLWWKDADSPLQFLAWCFEYAEWRIDPYGFESRIAVSMDGSCNGLQNFSAMLRDEIGGQATNLTDNAVMEDIYRRVAEAATKRMRSVAETPFTKRWLEHGIDRSVVKRAVMTTPYGVTKRSAVKYVIEDYLSKGKAPCFENKEYYEAAAVLMEFAWPAIGDVVVKSREAMDWLTTCAKAIVKEHGEDHEGVISWVTPSGFLATQSYYEIEEHRINTRVHGTTKIKVVSEGDEASSKRHASGLAPNFVHSMDASHLHLTTAAASLHGIDALAMIHDDYGTHAAKSELLYQLIRKEFVDMYEAHDPIKDLAEAYPCCPKPPSKGNLDLREVLRSHYFFS